jgi:hypothetical protein
MRLYVKISRSEKFKKFKNRPEIDFFQPENKF